MPLVYYALNATDVIRIRSGAVLADSKMPVIDLHIIRHSDIETIKQHIHNTPADISAHDKQWGSPLHYAVEANRVDVVSVLISAGAEVDVNGGPWFKEMTALQFAAYKGKITMVAALLDHGASITATDPKGRTARDLAQEFGHQDIVQYLDGRK